MKEIKNLKINENLDEEVLRKLHLRKIALGEIQGPTTGLASQDMPWLKYYSEEAIKAELPKMKIVEYLYKQNEDNLESKALVFENFQCNYKELFENIDSFAKSFQAIGVKEGDIVTVCMPTLPETVYAFYALNKLGAIPDMIDPRSSVGQLQYYLNENNSKFMLLYDECLIKVHKAYEGTKLEKVILSSASESMSGALKFVYDKFIHKEYIKEKDVKNDGIDYISMKEFKNKGNNITEIKESKYKKDNVTLIVHSSGTTSVPKGICLTNDNINALAFQYKISPLDLQKNDKFLSVIPAFAAFGMVASVHLPLSIGMENILIPKPSSDKFDKLFLKYRPNHCLTVPKNYEALAKSKKIKDLSYFKSPGCGGDAPSEEEFVNKFLKEKGCPSPLLKGWGMSELSSTACLENYDCAKLVSSGIPLVKNKVMIVNPETKEEVNIGESGEIVVSGPTIMKKYLNNQQLTEKVIKTNTNSEKIVYSGDIGYMSNDGCVYVTDRIDRMIIKYDGKKIYPRTIETAILSNEFVESCCVISANSNLGKIPKAYIVLKEEYKNSENECLNSIKETCAKELEERIIPNSFEFIPELPHTAMDKIDFKTLEKNCPKVYIKK